MAEMIGEEKLVVARKDYRCSLSGIEIKKGEKYYRSTIKNDGEVYTWRESTKVTDLRNEMIAKYPDMPDGYNDTDFADFVQEEKGMGIYQYLQSLEKGERK